MTGPREWIRARTGVRVASALSAAAVVAVALVVAGAALVVLVGQSLHHTAESTAERRTAQLLYRVEHSFEGAANKNAFGAVDVLTTDDDLAQILVSYADDGKPPVVEGSTPPVGKKQPMAAIGPVGDGVTVVSDVDIRTVDGATVRAVLAAAGGVTEDQPVTVLYAQPLTAVTEATDTLLFYLLFGVPMLILVVGAATYLFAGRALAPVEAIRARVAAMSGKDLDRRVPVPAAHDEVRRLAETMNAMIGRLEDAQGVQRRFVADASHELRSPLATIAAGLELLQRDTSDPATVATLRTETERVNRLVEALLLLARADERGLTPRREELDLDEIADAERGRPGDGLLVEVRAQPVRMVGDRGQLVRVVRNLVDNARCHARSHVLVTVTGDGDGAVIEVADDGPGVPPADRARVFERFVRLDDARARHDGGSGLGLAIVAEVVAAHGGTVELTEGPAGGALFRVRLPAQAGPEGADEPTALARERAARPSPIRHQGGPAPLPTGPVPPGASGPTLVPVPIRDEDARRDPTTTPWGVPAQQSGTAWAR